MYNFVRGFVVCPTDFHDGRLEDFYAVIGVCFYFYHQSHFTFAQVTKNRFDGVLGRVPLEFVRESLSMSGFGKQLPPNKTFNVDKRSPEKLKATRLAANLDVVKFSAPQIIGSNKMYNRSTVLPKPTDEERRDDIANHNTTSTSNTQDRASSEHGPIDRISDEKKETVQRTVKKILSGTRLFTKAVNSPRNYYSRTEGSQVNRKPSNKKEKSIELNGYKLN